MFGQIIQPRLKLVLALCVSTSTSQQSLPNRPPSTINIKNKIRFELAEKSIIKLRLPAAEQALLIFLPLP